MSSAPVAARTDDVHDIWRLRRQLEDWIAAQGIDQWLPGEVPEAVIDEQVGLRQWYVLRQQAKLAAALRLLWSDPDVWDVPDGESIFVHGLMVDRSRAGTGLGASLLDWAAAQAQRRGARWVRLDCAATNTRLCHYYCRQGFTMAGFKKLSGDLFDVNLWQRPVEQLHRPF